MSTQSKACCTVPPVVSEGYKEKGEWITINGMKTYATGPKEAKSALLVVYDIFGGFAGADILAHSNKDHQASSRRHCRVQTSSHTLTKITSTKFSCLVSFVFLDLLAIEKDHVPSLRDRHRLSTFCVLRTMWTTQRTNM
jgi:hypothetical protein